MSAHERHALHLNSLLCWLEGKEELFGKRESAVLKTVERLGRASDREVMLALGFVDPNATRPRISEAIKEGILVEVGTQEDPITRKQVRVVALAPDPRKAQRMFEFIESKAS